jgi:hypothetical protein
MSIAFFIFFVPVTQIVGDRKRIYHGRKGSPGANMRNKAA